MTNIEQKALALANEVSGRGSLGRISLHTWTTVYKALCRAIEQHEAFRQEVSDAVVEYKADQPYVWKQSASDYFCRFIILKPNPDPLVEAMADCGVDRFESWADQLRAALDARGLEIREKGQ